MTKVNCNDRKITHDFTKTRQLQYKHLLFLQPFSRNSNYKLGPPKLDAVFSGFGWVGGRSKMVQMEILLNPTYSYSNSVRTGLFCSVLSRSISVTDRYADIVLDNNRRCASSVSPKLPKSTFSHLADNVLISW